MEHLKNMSMSELITAYNALAAIKGVEPTTEFKNLAAGRAAITQLEGRNVDETQTQAVDPATQATENDGASLLGAGATPIKSQDELIAEAVARALSAGVTAGSTDASKYSTVGKRGPNQGIGEFAKQLLVAGMSTGDVLNKVREQFPTAKTSASCIAYYKAALKNPNLGKRKGAADPAALRAKAAELMAAATAAEQAAVEAAQRAASNAAAAALAAENAIKQQAAIAEAIKAQQAATAAAQSAAAEAAIAAQKQAAELMAQQAAATTETNAPTA